MDKNIAIQDVMTKFVYTIGKEQNLKIAKQKMNEHRIRHLPVQDAGKLVGVISDRDIHFALAFEHKNPEELKVKDILTEYVYVVSPEEKVDTVSRKMAIEHIGCCLVEEEGKLKGIFTTVDACHLLAEVLSEKIEQ